MIEKCLRTSGSKEYYLFKTVGALYPVKKKIWFVFVQISCSTIYAVLLNENLRSISNFIHCFQRYYLEKDTAEHVASLERLAFE